MPFTEAIKKEAKSKANYKCCVCQAPFVEVHHIIPEHQDGTSELDNAAPLCAGCHHKYGGNPELRKQLREMRDHWWEICGIQQPSESIYKKLDSLGNDVSAIKDMLVPFLRKKLDEIETTSTVEELSLTLNTISSGAPSGYSRVLCPECDSPMQLKRDGRLRCPQCNT